VQQKQQQRKNEFTFDMNSDGGNKSGTEKNATQAAAATVAKSKLFDQN
jgi:hypothetical protein